MDDIKFQIKLPVYEEPEEGGKESKNQPKGDKSKRCKGEAPRRTRAQRCDRCCYCCVLCCESVFFTVGSAIRILVSVVVVGLMFWTALYVYTTLFSDDQPSNGSRILRDFDGTSDGFNNFSGADPGGLEAKGVPVSSEDLRSGGFGEPAMFVTLADSDNGSNSPRDPGGDTDDSSAAGSSNDSHSNACSDNSCLDDAGDLSTVSSSAADPDDVVDTSDGPGVLADTSDGPGVLADTSDGPGVLADTSDGPGVLADTSDGPGVLAETSDGPGVLADTSDGPGVLVSHPGESSDGDDSGESGDPGGGSVPDGTR